MNRRIITLFVALASFFTPDISSAGIRIIRGQPASVRAVPVVKIIGHDAEGEYLCSGGLISPRVVLTASHCIAAVPSAMSVYIHGVYRGVSTFRVHPGAAEDPSSGVISNDVAILFLSRPVHGRYFSILRSHKSMRGDRISIYGFGITDQGTFGNLRSGTMVVSSTDRDFVYARFTGVLSNTCNGDSGGPAVTSYKDAKGRSHTGIVAVTSGGENASCGPGDLSYFSKVQNASTWQFLRRNVRNLSVR